ncbi:MULTISPECIES: sugar transferase [Olivibacter]|jgi:lipopolysaccharide/colanic/teichoic acid biosynthesis glycosyltransferase|uniref:Sugar transferase n=1 Tax=Olivibacter oleidegradans TaxID=760123 RepID=A0ABV6HMR3_9SPHI|nr:sugar transferase [Olivibacter jilunii]MDX3915424.1 sugar transferase [Pseudosphingobacterium sp.]
MKNPYEELEQRRAFVPNLAYCGQKYVDELQHLLERDFDLNFLASTDALKIHLEHCSIITSPEIIIMEVDEERAVFPLINAIRTNPLTSGSVIILIADKKDAGLKARSLKAKVNDFYVCPFDKAELMERLKFLIKFKLIKPDIKKLIPNTVQEYKIPPAKRLFDVFFSALAVLLLLPVFLLIAICIKLESKGPVFYKSKRAGTGYRIFDFYKFRSMAVGADAKLKDLAKTSNQYAGTEASANEPLAFVKIKNDPRVTKVGNFIRNTSLDELPQLFNVLKGDMSIVGNRPLPLYEAEQLTSNLWSMRFLGPAGITGLWQITKRGKSEMSDEERKGLDNFYAQHSSVWIDLKILLKTFPALLQKEKV